MAMFNLRSITFLLTILILAINPVWAAKKKRKSPARPKQTSIVVNMNDGSVEHFEDAHKKIYPASLTKLMTLYLTFDALKKGKLKMSQKLKTSKAASKMKPCKLGLGVGQRITVEKAVDALIVRSANDVAVVLAEAVAGDEKRFASLMTRKARKLGMSSTTFKNASGWHHKDQKTTAIDMAKLAIALKRDHPEYYSRFGKSKFVFNGNTIYSHNKVTKQYDGAEGMKTGYTSHAGYNLVTTASRDGKSLVAVVTGGPTSVKRNKKVMSLLDKGFLASNDNKQNLISPNSHKKSARQLASNHKRKSSKATRKIVKHTSKQANKKRVMVASNDAFTKIHNIPSKRQNIKANVPSKKSSISQKNRRTHQASFKSSKVAVNPSNTTKVASSNYDPFSMLGS